MSSCIRSALDWPLPEAPRSNSGSGCTEKTISTFFFLLRSLIREAQRRRRHRPNSGPTLYTMNPCVVVHDSAYGCPSYGSSSLPPKLAGSSCLQRVQGQPALYPAVLLQWHILDACERYASEPQPCVDCERPLTARYTASPRPSCRSESPILAREHTCLFDRTRQQRRPIGAAITDGYTPGRICKHVRSFAGLIRSRPA